MITFWPKLRIPTIPSFQSAINDSDIMCNFEMNFILGEPLLPGKTNDTLDNQINSFVLLTFDKTVILEVSRMGTINLALRPDVYCIILQSLEVLSRLKACFFYAMDA